METIKPANEVDDTAFISAKYECHSNTVEMQTPILCNMAQWKHSTKFFEKKLKCGTFVIDIDLSKEEFQYLHGHIIDGRIMFPPSGYMVLVWKTFAQLKNVHHEQLPIILEDVQFTRATIMRENGSVKFGINIIEESGEFAIFQSGSIVVSGKIYVPENIEKEFLKLPICTSHNDHNALPLNKSDIYKELRLRGYNYKNTFREIQKSDNHGVEGVLHWENNWIRFIDSAIQFSILGLNIRELYLPTRLHKLTIDPNVHNDFNKKEIPVYNYHKIDVIKAGAIELRGLKFSLASRQQTQVAPTLEKCQFVPLENNTILAYNEENCSYNALTVASQIVFENSSRGSTFNVVEVVGERHTSILPKVQNIFGSEPLIHIDAVTVTSNEMDEKLSELSRSDTSCNAFDMVVLVDVLVNSQEKLIVKAMASLKPGGFILLEEPKSQLNTQLLASHSLVIIYKQVSITKMYMLVRKSVAIPQKPIIVRITEKSYDWLEPLKQAMQTSDSNGTRVYLVCQGENLTGLVGMMNCVKHEAGGNNVRSVFIQDMDAEPFSITSKYYSEQLKKDLLHNVLKNGVWGTYRHLPLVQEADRRQVEDAYVNTLTRGDLSSLRWIEGPFRFYNSKELCTVYYAPINCQDVMLATGKSPVDVLPNDLPRQDCTFGVEFSGRDSQGRRVMGMVAGRSFATTILADPVLTWEVPEKWSLEEAATIPIVYGTSYYALIIRGKMQPGECILIHEGTGGVELASITIALHMGCKVFTTVSSQAKRDFLKLRFLQLTDECVGNSRDTSFEQMILTQTNGHGVDLVLISSTGNQKEALVRCLANGGRFLEIGTDNVSPLGMDMMLKNTTFHYVLLNCIFTSDHTEKNELRRLVTEGIESSAVQPLPSTTYPENQVQVALGFLASEKSIGKVLLKLRDEESRTTVLPGYKTVTAIPKLYADPEKVYVLVGGLGGIGLEVTNWLITRGAKKIVLSSRGGIKNGYQSLCVRRWKNENVIINISTADVTTENGARQLFEESNKIGPIGGVFNLATAVVGVIMNNQTEEMFDVVCKPKIDVTKHLDAVSRLLAPRLDYFVVFSSVFCGRGDAGAVSYGYANSAMERICEERHAAGLPATAIQLGAVGDVGTLAEMFSEVTEVLGTGIQSISSCLSALEIFLQQPQPVVSSFVLAQKANLNMESKQDTLFDAVTRQK